MSVIESLPYALFVMAVVFAVLIILCAIIKLFSIIIGSFSKNVQTKPVASPVPQPVFAAAKGPEMSNGELKLYNVDEPTAAMVMAIVSDEAGIPLDELCFKSIKVKSNA